MTSLRRTAWLVVALLWPVALLNYLDRQMLAAMKFSVMTDIPNIGTEANWGLMLGQFKWVYAALSPIGGYVADRFSRRLTICGSLFVWSAVTWWTGHVTNYGELLLARSLMGVSEAFYIPAALALIADFHTGSTRSRAVGLHQMAIYCGVIAGGFGGYVADAPAQGEAGIAATLYFQAAAIGGAVLGGWLADRWMRRNDRGRIFVSAIGMGLICPAIFGVGSAGSLAVAVTFLMLFGLGWGFFDCNNMPILCQVV